MFAVKVESELPKMLEKLKGIAPEMWPKILANAANETGYYVLNKYKQQMREIFDRPTPFTINSMYLQKATPSNLEATVQWRDFAGKGTSAGKYLKPDVEGGTRPLKRFEVSLQQAGLMPRGYFAIPSDKCPLDSFGNVSLGLYTAILSYLRASNDPMQNRRMDRYKRMGASKFVKQFVKTAMNSEQVARREAKSKAKKAKYFTIQPGQSTLAPGIWQRSQSGVITQLFFFSTKAAYKSIFAFNQIGSDAAQSKFPSKLDEAIAASVSGRSLSA